MEQEIEVLTEKLNALHDKAVSGKITAKRHEALCYELAKRRDGLRAILKARK